MESNMQCGVCGELFFEDNGFTYHMKEIEGHKDFVRVVRGELIQNGTIRQGVYECYNCCEEEGLTEKSWWKSGGNKQTDYDDMLISVGVPNAMGYVGF